MLPQKSNLTNLLLFISFPVLSYAYNLRAKKRKKFEEPHKWSSVIRPPFPPVIREMLSSCRLAYLSTVEGNSSHLSLMRFTYCVDKDDGEVVIMTTNKNTKKFNILQKQNGVALLVHDFPQFDSEGAARAEARKGIYSITLNGQCQIVEDGEKAEIYRKKHLEHNPDYPQFIVGSDIMVLCIFITSASICNINDEVTKWSINDRTS